VWLLFLLQRLHLLTDLIFYLEGAIIFCARFSAYCVAGVVSGEGGRSEDSGLDSLALFVQEICGALLRLLGVRSGVARLDWLRRLDYWTVRRFTLLGASATLG